MHEMSLAHGVLDILEDSARKQGFARVKTVWLEIGALAGVDPEAIRFCFDAVTRNTLAHGAELDIIAVPGQAWCMQCCQAVTIAARMEPCPVCGGYRLQVTGGEEMRVKELQVE